MLRTALRPKWLALLGLALVVVVVFGWLGLWQLNVAQQRDQAEILDQVQATPEMPIDQVLAPQGSFVGDHLGRAVTATGRYDAAGQVLVTGRRLGEQSGAWVLTPLVVDTSGARLAVVRGFLPEGQSAPTPPQGEVTVRGSLQPQEGPADEPRVMPTGQLQTVDLARLVNVWPGRVYNGFVFATAESPAPDRAAPLTAVPPPAVDPGGIHWRNAAYAVQWWIFAGFVLYVWWRMVRDDYRLGRGLAEPASPPEHDSAAGTSTPASTASSAGGSTR